MSWLRNLLHKYLQVFNHTYTKSTLVINRHSTQEFGLGEKAEVITVAHAKCKHCYFRSRSIVEVGSPEVNEIIESIGNLNKDWKFGDSS